MQSLEFYPRRIHARQYHQAQRQMAWGRNQSPCSPMNRRWKTPLELPRNSWEICSWGPTSYARITRHKAHPYSLDRLPKTESCIRISLWGPQLHRGSNGRPFETWSCQQRHTEAPNRPGLRIWSISFKVVVLQPYDLELLRLAFWACHRLGFHLETRMGLASNAESASRTTLAIVLPCRTYLQLPISHY